MELINKLRILAEDLYSAGGHNRYATALSQAADELERLERQLTAYTELIDHLETVEKERDAAAEMIERVESDLATAEQDSRQKQARIERLETGLGEIAWSNDSKWQSDRAKAALEESK